MTDLSVPPYPPRCSPTPSACCSRPPASIGRAVARARRRSTTHDVDFADLYFQQSRFESWSLEEGIVKSGHVQHRPRRRRARGQPATSRRSRIPTTSRCRRSTRPRSRCARSAARDSRPSRRSREQATRACAVFAAPIRSRASPKPTRSRCSRRLERMARARDPRVAQVMASLAGEHETVLVARSDGMVAADVRPLVRVSITVIVEENGRREQGYSRRRRPLRLRVLRRRDARRVREAGGRPGAAQPRRARPRPPAR